MNTADKIGARRLIKYTKQMVGNAIQNNLFEAPNQTAVKKKLEDNINCILPCAGIKNFQIKNVKATDVMEVSFEFVPTLSIEHIQVSVSVERDKEFWIQQLKLPLKERSIKKEKNEL